ncbi:MAG: hypothetical protein HWN81_18010 [Candidatus Lokiarchaeota archaeon]|nr:hypothetical protein [Candidatus Lokiarchaeota archaeon]
MANTTSTLTSKIGYQIRDTNASESSFINTTKILYSGIGSGQADYGVYDQVALGVGGSVHLNMQALSKPLFDLNPTVNFQKIKAIGIYNEATQTGTDVLVKATGNGLTEIFNGGTGNVVVKAYGVYQYWDVISGVTVDASNRNLSITNAGTTGCTISYSIVGVTGT